MTKVLTIETEMLQQIYCMKTLKSFFSIQSKITGAVFALGSSNVKKLQFLADTDFEVEIKCSRLLKKKF
jgi:hypothetical protein